ncbi:hypothetical protein B0H19DRAFT_1284327 [Mycena capillaripes]|nr:hypothetical protein B0H19DRAFT_1284327 [Mycena capillaripes]
MALIFRIFGEWSIVYASHPAQKMPDPISAATTFITLATFIKDLLDLGQSIRRSIEKVRANETHLRALGDDIVRTLADLRDVAVGQENAFLAPQLVCALAGLKRDMLYTLSVTDDLTPGRTPGLRGLCSRFTAWLRREDVEIEIRNLKERVTKCYIQFTAFSVVRTEYTALRIEQAMLLQSAENSAKLQRLEGIITQLLLDIHFRVHRTTIPITQHESEDGSIPPNARY